MKSASISEIKTGLKEKSAPQLAALCLRLARYKKENKELLSFLLYDGDDIESYISSVKEEMNESFAGVNTKNIYLAKKSIRKILRIANKHIKYMADKEAEASVLIHFCAGCRGLQLPVTKNTALTNLYNTQLKKIEAAIGAIHEDLQHDYERDLARLR